VPSVTVRGASGRWLVLHASRVAGRTDECIAVVIAPATTRAELQPMLAAGYGLTPREAGVLSCLLRGLATKTIAADLGITANTAHGHIKSIYAKTGVGLAGS
jgi:DNA-binding CsgD family transcriptional regulator